MDLNIINFQINKSEKLAEWQRCIAAKMHLLLDSKATVASVKSCFAVSAAFSLWVSTAPEGEMNNLVLAYDGVWRGKYYLEPQGQPLKNGWLFGDFQPFPM